MPHQAFQQRGFFFRNVVPDTAFRGVLLAHEPDSFAQRGKNLATDDTDWGKSVSSVAKFSTAYRQFQLEPFQYHFLILPAGETDIAAQPLVPCRLVSLK
jgi:hypothetical protein